MIKLIYLKSALKCDSFDVAIGIKILFLRVLVTIEQGGSLLQFVTTNCLIKQLIGCNHPWGNAFVTMFQNKSRGIVFLQMENLNPHGGFHENSQFDIAIFIMAFLIISWLLILCILSWAHNFLLLTLIGNKSIGNEFCIRSEFQVIRITLQSKFFRYVYCSKASFFNSFILYWYGQPLT